MHNNTHYISSLNILSNNLIIYPRITDNLLQFAPDPWCGALAWHSHINYELNKEVIVLLIRNWSTKRQDDDDDVITTQCMTMVALDFDSIDSPLTFAHVVGVYIPDGTLTCGVSADRVARTYAAVYTAL